jgi:tetratricopeptide (TPR) repeat protein
MKQSLKVLVFAAFALSSFLVAAQTPVTETKAERKASPGASPVAGDVKAPEKSSDYSQEGFVYELYRTVARFEKDGTGSREYSARVRVQSEAGVQALGQLVFGYNSANERMEINYVRVRKADGSVVTASADSVQDLTAPVQREAPVYTDFRQKHVTVSALRPGEILEYKVTAILHTPYAAGQFWFSHDFEQRVIVLNEEFELSIPRAREIKLKSKPEFSPVITESGDRRVYLWKSSNLKRDSDDDDRRKKGSKKKSRDFEFSDVQITTFHTWEEVGKWYAALERDRIAATPEISAKAAELTKGRKTDQEKLEAIYDYVAKNFRYVSLSLGLGRYQPHAASEVLANQYGDCKDKHTLLSALVRAAGMHADAVLINSSRKIDPDVPSPSQFDHLISAVPIGPQKIWLDTTTEVAPFGLLAMTLRDKQALLVTQGQAARLIETPPDPPFSGEQSLDVEGKVSELGKLTAHAKFTLRGDAELIARVTFRRIPQSQWKRVARVFAATLGLPGDVDDFRVEDPADTKKPFSFELDVSAANYVDWTSKRSQLEPPIGLMAMPDFADQDGDDDEGGESEPLKLGGPGVISARFKLELPAKFSVRLPVAVSIKRDFAEYRSDYKVDGQTVSGERLFRVSSNKLPRERKNEYAAFRRAVLADRDQKLQLETKTAGASSIPEGLEAEELFDGGRAAMAQLNFSTAVELFKRTVEKEPKHKYAWNNLGLAYLGQRKFAESISAFNKQLEVNPYDEYAYNNLGRAYLAQTNYTAAGDAFRKQIEINPLDRFAHSNLGGVLLEQKKYSDAASELEKAVSITPDDPRAHVMLGRAELNLGNSEKALAAFDKAVEIAPTHFTWNEIAYELSERQVHLDRAQHYAESAIATTSALLRNLEVEQLGPPQLLLVDSLAAEWDTLGWIHFRLGNLDQAEKFIRSAWRLSQHGEVGDHLAQIYEKRGNKELAMKTLALAINGIRPKPEAKQRLTTLAGGAKPADALIAKYRSELPELRTIRLGKVVAPAKEKRTAEFMALLARNGVTGVKFVNGDETLRSTSAVLRNAKFPVEFPDSTDVKLARRGQLACEASGECAFVLYTPEEVISAE